MSAVSDKIEGLEADLESAVEVAFKRGAVEWTRLNYPKLYERLAKMPVTKKHWILTMTVGRSKWARSDKYQEFQATVLTDVHPAIYILKCKEWFWDDEWEAVCDFKLACEIAAGEVPQEDLDLWDTRSFLKQYHRRGKNV